MTGALKAAQGVFIFLTVFLDADREEWRDHLPARHRRLPYSPWCGLCNSQITLYEAHFLS